MNPEQTLTAEPRVAISSAPCVLTIRIDEQGTIVDVAGAWIGGRTPSVTRMRDLVHPDDHDAFAQVCEWVTEGGSCDFGLDLHVRGQFGWDPAKLYGIPNDDDGHLTFSLVPTFPDPASGALDFMFEGRDLASVLDEILAVFADLDMTVWATAHYGADDDGRYRNVVATTGLDTFRRAVEAAAAADPRCPWDEDVDRIDDYLEPLVTADFSDGITLASRHAGIGGCQLVPVPSVATGDVATLAVWTESVEALSHPSLAALISRVRELITLAFQHQASHDALKLMATRDALTGLWNRQAFFAQLRTPRAQRHCAIAYIDVDEFRAVNEWRGHAVGDALLVELGRRLRDAMRPGDLLARVSADEFAVLLTEVKSADAASAIAGRMHAIFEAPFHLGGESSDVSATIGLAVVSPERNGIKLLDAAERTMLETKKSDKGTWQLAT